MEEVEAARERELQATEAKLGPANSVRPYQRKRVPKNQEAEITRLQKRSVRLQKEAAITQRQALLEEEPSLEQVAQKKAVQLRLRLPSGENVKRNFLLSHPVEQVRLFAEISYPFLIYNPTSCWPNFLEPYSPFGRSLSPTQVLPNPWGWWWSCPLVSNATIYNKFSGPKHKRQTVTPEIHDLWMTITIDACVVFFYLTSGIIYLW